MQQVEQQTKNPWPVLITAQGKSIPLDHVLKIDTSALESHRTILIHTTTGAEMFHDEVALALARAFNLRPAEPAASPERTQTARSQQPVASGGKKRKG
ncbi:MAG TPA: hypothetical protein VK752_05250 [Bryobacteraceae bacterium]|jgi:hypothetical protein|nr:hypothetical protein [Bryobacteraceae bacterium]